MKSITGTVFDIQHYSIHDGPGIRTNVFVKGCPLRCRWGQIPVIVRTPIMPGYNDTVENMRAMAEFIRSELPTCREVNLLPYHPLGESKKAQLESDAGERYDRPENVHMEELREVFKAVGIICK